MRARRGAGAPKSPGPQQRCVGCAPGYSSASLSAPSDALALLLATNFLGCHGDGPLRCRDGHLCYWRGASRLEGRRPAHVLAVGCHPVIRVGIDRVVTGPAEDVVRISVCHEEDIVAVASARPFVRVAAKEEAVVAAVAGEVVPAGITQQSVVVSAAVKIVVAIPAEHELSSLGASIKPGLLILYGAGERVGWINSVGRTRATVDVVGAPATKPAVSAESERDVVTAPAAVHPIVPPTGGDDIGAAQGEDNVALGCAGDDVA